MTLAEVHLSLWSTKMHGVEFVRQIQIMEPDMLDHLETRTFQSNASVSSTLWSSRRWISTWRLMQLAVTTHALAQPDGQEPGYVVALITEGWSADHAPRASGHQKMIWCHLRFILAHCAQLLESGRRTEART